MTNPRLQTGTFRPGIRRTTTALLAAGVLTVLAASPVWAHPLGNFTINRYDGITLSADGAVIDHVLDMAEIPALQERQRMDRDGDGTVSDLEGAEWASAACRQFESDLRLSLGGTPMPLVATRVGLTFPSGQANLLTLRLVCTYETSFPLLEGTTTVDFRDDTYAGRIGWREIVVAGDGVSLGGAEAYQTGGSDRLTAYPAAQIATPRDQSAATFTVSPGGPAAPAADVRDAVPIDSSPEEVMRAGSGTAALPGGVTDLPRQISDIIQARDLDLAAIVLSLLVAAGVGAVHAASPGHGKTLMAAYLVGTRGTVRHAMGLGLTVTISHTIGVLALGGMILFAGALIPPERLFPILGFVSGLVVVAIGLGLLAQRLRESRARQRLHEPDPHVHGEEHGHDHHHDHDAPAHDAAHSDDPHDQGQETPRDAGGSPDETVGGWHSHGLVRHTHLPPGDDPLRWRNIVALGLVGGLVPSASAILILVGSIAAGRPAFGMVLTLAFGAGMAVVLVGVGVLLVRARAVIERWPRTDRLGPLLARLPLVSALLFVAVGAVITVQAGLQLR